MRIALIRRPGRHADRHTDGTRRVYAAHTVPGGTWLREADIDDPARLLGLDLGALGAGDADGFDRALDGRAHTGTPDPRLHQRQAGPLLRPAGAPARPGAHRLR